MSSFTLDRIIKEGKSIKNLTKDMEYIEKEVFLCKRCEQWFDINDIHLGDFDEPLCSDCADDLYRKGYDAYETY